MKTKIILIGIFFGLLGAAPLLTQAFSSSDINSDTCTDASDFYVLQDVFGRPNTQADLNASGQVDLVDLSVLAHNWAPCPNTVNIRDLYPPAPNKNLTFDGYNPDGSLASVYEVLRYEPWADGKHFTVHHLYANVGSPVAFCPRVDDVFLMSQDKLFYTNTINFYPVAQDPAGLTHTTYTPGQVWGKGTMFLDTETPFETMTGIIGDIQQSGCYGTSAVTRPGTATHQTQYGITSSTSWSVFTGGEANPVSTIQLTEFTKYNGAEDDLFKEVWQFYNDPTYGYIPIEITILVQKPGEPALHEISHERLKSVSE